MGKLWLLAAANLRKGKGQAASFFLMIFLSALLLNLGLVTWLNYDNAFDRRAEELNSADVIAVLQNTNPDYTRKLERELREDSRTEQLEARSAQYLAASCIYGEGETTRKFAVLPKEAEGEMGKVSYVEQLEEKVEHPIYLPYLFQTGGGYQLGDAFLLNVITESGEKEFRYRIKGFFEETILGTINSTTTGLILEDAEYRELSETFAGALDGTLFLVRLRNPDDGEMFCSEHTPSISPLEALSDAVFYQFVRQSRTITSSIGSMIVVAFSMLIVLIALIVVRFRIGNTIEEDMKNIGALKALGYRSRQIMASILLQFLSVGAAAAAAGVAVSYLVLPLVSGMFAAQTGVVWKQGFDPVSAAVTLLFLLLTVAAVALFSARKVRRLPPIVALRSGILTHSFRRNPLPLDRGRGGLPFRLAGKAFLQNAGRNLLIGTIMLAIGFSGVFAGVLYYNSVIKVENFLVSCAGELFSIQLDAVSPQAAAELLEKLESSEKVRQVFTYTTTTLKGADGQQIFSHVTQDYARFDNQNMAYEGRFPKYENEVALGGLLARELGKSPGDTIRLADDEYEAEYLITGLIQGSNFMGHDTAMTEEGYRRIHPGYQPATLAIYLKDGQDSAAFIQSLKETDGSRFASVYDYEKVVGASLGTYQGIIAMLVMVVMAVVLAIVALTLYLVVKTALLRSRRELGIQKAVGFTTGQLVLQTALGFLPVILLGSGLGCVLGYFGVNPVLSLLFSGIGMMKMNFTILPSLLVLICAGITLFGFLISILVSSRIRKITPYALVSE